MSETERQSKEHIRLLKETFGNEPTWGMVEMAFRTGWLAAETGWRYPQPCPPVVCDDGGTDLSEAS